MGDTTHRIRIVLDTSGVQTGTQQIRSELNQIGQAADATSAKVSGVSTKLRSTVGAIASSQAGILGVANAMNGAAVKAASSFSTLNAGLKNTASTAAATSAAAVSGFASMEKAIDKARFSLNFLGAGFGGLRARISETSSLLGPLTAGFAALFAVREISEFNDQMATVRAVTLASDADFKKLRDTALGFGATTRYSATQAAQGLELLARAGAGTKGSIDLLTPTLRLAQAENLSLAESSDYLAKITQGMNLPLAEGGRVADVLAQTASSTATDVRQLGQAMKYAATISAGFNNSVEDVAAALGVLGNKGLVADQAGTAIRGFLSRDVGLTKEFGKDLAKVLGTDVPTALEKINPQTHSLIEILETLKKANISTSESFKLFEQRAGTGAAILIQNVEAVKELANTLQNARGNLERKFEIKADTLSNDLNAALAAVRALVIAVGDAGLERVVRTTLQVFTVGMRGIVSLIQVMTPLIQTVGIAITASFAPQTVLAFGRALLIAAGAMRALAVAALAFSLSNPVTAALVGIAAAIGGVIILVQQFGDSIRIPGTRFATLSDLFNVVTTKIGGYFKFMGDAVLSVFDLIGKGAALAANFIVETFFAAINKVINAFRDVAVGIPNVFREAFGQKPIELPPFKIDAPSLGFDLFSGIKAAADQQALSRIGEEKSSRADLVTTLHQQALAQQQVLGTGNRLTDEEQRRHSLLTRILETQKNAILDIAELNKLFAQGKITVEQYNDVLQQLREQLLKQNQTVSGGILQGLNEVTKGVTKTGDAIASVISNAFSHATDAIVQFTQTGKLSFKDFTQSILADLVRLTTNRLFGMLAQSLLGPAGGGGGLGGFNVLFGGGSGFGFASGGSFTVGGDGGTDTTPVSFWATRGEKVSVQTPGQQAASGGNVQVNVFNAPPGTQVKQRQGAGGQTIVDIVHATVKQGFAGGQYDQSMQGRFGLPVASVRR